MVEQDTVHERRRFATSALAAAAAGVAALIALGWSIGSADVAVPSVVVVLVLSLLTIGFWRLSRSALRADPLLRGSRLSFFALLASVTGSCFSLALFGLAAYVALAV